MGRLWGGVLEVAGEPRGSDIPTSIDHQETVPNQDAIVLGWAYCFSEVEIASDVGSWPAVPIAALLNLNPIEAPGSAPSGIWCVCDLR